MLIKSKDYLVLCNCTQPEHQLLLRYFADDKPNEKLLYIDIHLAQWRNFFQRIIPSIGYLFGYKSRHGAFDEIMLAPDSVKDVIDYLQEFLDTHVE
jgi:hypothetical protein